jgi:SWI/SNF-related matrix-associated actin-dependent regulator of chromatin subfamily A3
MTGTPIQNKLTDFASIAKFLKVYPYCDRKIFDKEILAPWQNPHGVDPQGFLRLKALVRAITISRTKRVVQLPPRIDEIHRLDFAPVEREKYEAAKTQSRTLLEEAISSGTHETKTFNVFRLLNILRLICNHGLLARSLMEDELAQAFLAPLDAPDSFCGEIVGCDTICSNCSASLLENLFEEPPSADFVAQGRMKSNRDMLCEQCCSKLNDDPFNHVAINPLDRIEGSDFKPGSASEGLEDVDVLSSTEYRPTKMKALVADLVKHCPTEKRFASSDPLLVISLTSPSVVFSYWTSTLNIVQSMLQDSKPELAYTRIDGKMPLTKRTEALHAFQQHDNTRVILVSITCGGAGYVAS